MRRNDGSHDFEHVNRVRKLALRIADDECKRSGPGSVDFATVELWVWFSPLVFCLVLLSLSLSLSLPSRSPGPFSRSQLQTEPPPSLRPSLSPSLPSPFRAALLHEIDDWKYATKEGQDASAVAASGPVRARAFLLAEGVKKDEVEKICMVVKMSSFHDELRQLEEAEAKDKENGSGSDNAGEGAAEGAAGLPLELLCVQDADRIDAIGAMGIARCLMFGGKK